MFFGFVLFFKSHLFLDLYKLLESPVFVDKSQLHWIKRIVAYFNFSIQWFNFPNETEIPSPEFIYCKKVSSFSMFLDAVQDFVDFNFEGGKDSQ